ncbi:uncharacterized protein [Cherax quadricarinatus]|uniref:uncharacterized protein isoform X2 n=1 Tax=Cherax quadricarinatus TaxID=27406 RepID=UPI0023783751|nr:uncharacterized protein LOC128685444 isoform X2 [Cherax quadricarinatus]
MKLVIMMVVVSAAVCIATLLEDSHPGDNQSFRFPREEWLTLSPQQLTYIRSTLECPASERCLTTKNNLAPVTCIDHSSCWGELFLCCSDACFKNTKICKLGKRKNRYLE